MPKRSTIDLRDDPREHVQTVIARCYVGLAEVDYDLQMWRAELDYPWRVITDVQLVDGGFRVVDLRVPSEPLTRI